MSYPNKYLLKDETIGYRTKKHWVIFLIPMLWTLVTFGFCLNLPAVFNSLADFPSYPYLLAVIGGAPGIFALVLWIKHWLNYITAEFIITNKRLIMKEGFFIRRATDARLSTVSHVSIEQSLIGQLLNYGTVVIHNFGGTHDDFIQIAHPAEFQKQVTAQLDKLVK